MQFEKFIYLQILDLAVTLHGIHYFVEETLKWKKFWVNRVDYQKRASDRVDGRMKYMENFQYPFMRILYSNPPPQGRRCTPWNKDGPRLEID